MNIKLTNVIRDAASNLFIISGIAIIIVMVSMAVWILRKRGPGSPWVHTITESLPVVGLIGTFLGAFYVFIVPSEGKEGIVVAFIVSVAGWVGYIFLQFISTSKTKSPEQTVANALGLTRDIKSETTVINEKLLITLETLSNIGQKVFSIDAAIGKKKMKSLTQEVAGLNIQLELLSSNLNSCTKSFEAFNTSTSNDFQVLISVPPDLEKMVSQLESMNDILGKIEERKQTHEFKISYYSNVNRLEHILQTISESITKIMEADKNQEIKISTSEDFDEKFKSLSDLDQILQNIANQEKEYNLKIDYSSNVEHLDQLLVNIKNALQDIANINIHDRVKIVLPENIDDQIVSLNNLVQAMKNMDRAPKDQKAVVDISYNFEALKKFETQLLSIQKYLSLLAENNHKINFSLNLPEKLDTQVKSLKSIESYLAKLGDMDKKVSYDLKFNFEPEDIVDKLDSVRESYMPLIGLRKDLKFRVGINTSRNLNRTIREINSLSETISELDTTQKETNESTDRNTNMGTFPHQSPSKRALRWLRKKR